MPKQVTLSSGAWQKDLELTITIVDEEKLNNECKSINNFFCGSESRIKRHGDHVKAGLALFAAECFQQMAFNDFKDSCWLVEQFDWSKGKGVEGFPSIEDLGITIDAIESWSIDSSEIEFHGM